MLYEGAKFGYNVYKNWKQKNIDPTLPKDPFNDSQWEDISHHKGKEKGHFEFKNKKTGEKIRLDKGKPGSPGHEGEDHFHKYNPNSRNGDKDKYLDKDNNPVPKGSEKSHLYNE